MSPLTVAKVRGSNAMTPYGKVALGKVGVPAANVSPVKGDVPKFTVKVFGPLTVGVIVSVAGAEVVEPLRVVADATPSDTFAFGIVALYVPAFTVRLEFVAKEPAELKANGSLYDCPIMARPKLMLTPAGSVAVAGLETESIVRLCTGSDRNRGRYA